MIANGGEFERVGEILERMITATCPLGRSTQGCVRVCMRAFFARREVWPSLRSSAPRARSAHASADVAERGTLLLALGERTLGYEDVFWLMTEERSCGGRRWDGTRPGGHSRMGPGEYTGGIE